jgi:hypothetical protein
MASNQQPKALAHKTYEGLLNAKCPEDIDQREEKAKALRVVNNFNKDFLKTKSNEAEHIESYQFDLQDALVEANLLDAAKFVHLLFQNTDDTPAMNTPNQNEQSVEKVGNDVKTAVKDRHPPVLKHCDHDAGSQLSKSPPRKKTKIEDVRHKVEESSHVGEGLDVDLPPERPASSGSKLSGVVNKNHSKLVSEQQRVGDCAIMEDANFVVNNRLPAVLRWVEHDGGLSHYVSWEDMKRLRDTFQQRAASYENNTWSSSLSEKKEQWKHEQKLKDRFLKMHVQALYAIQFCRRPNKNRVACLDAMNRAINFFGRFQQDLATHNQKYDAHLTSLGADGKIGSTNITLLHTGKNQMSLYCVLGSLMRRLLKQINNVLLLLIAAVCLQDPALVQGILKLGAKDSIGSALALATRNRQSNTNKFIVELLQKHTIADLPRLEDPDWLIPQEKKGFLCPSFTKYHRCSDGRFCSLIHRHGPWRDLVDHIWIDMNDHDHSFPLNWEEFKDRALVQEVQVGDRAWFAAGFAHCFGHHPAVYNRPSVSRGRYKIVNVFYADGGNCETSPQGIAWYRSEEEALTALQKVVTISLWAMAQAKCPSDFAAPPL